jgi:hypothetical protein
MSRRTVSMLSINLVRSEWRKIATTPGIRRGLFGAYLLRVAFCLLMALAIPTDELTRLHSHDMVELVIKASRVTHILLAIIAASAVAMEYKSGQITRTLTWSPSRIVLICCAHRRDICNRYLLSHRKTNIAKPPHPIQLPRARNISNDRDAGDRRNCVFADRSIVGVDHSKHHGPGAHRYRCSDR